MLLSLHLLRSLWSPELGCIESHALLAFLREVTYP
jgi:hypothetical protein